MSAATAKIIFHSCLNLFRGRIRILKKKGRGIHYHPGCAKTALECIMINKSLLNRAQLIFLGQAFDGHDFLTLDIANSSLARSDSLAVDKNSAGSAKAGTTSKLRTGKSEMITKHPEEGLRRIQY